MITRSRYRDHPPMHAYGSVLTNPWICAWIAEWDYEVYCTLSLASPPFARLFVLAESTREWRLQLKCAVAASWWQQQLDKNWLTYNTRGQGYCVDCITKAVFHGSVYKRGRKVADVSRCNQHVYRYYTWWPELVRKIYRKTIKPTHA